MKKEKTVIKWLSLIPKEARENALENIKKEGNNPLMIETPTLQMALKGSFDWSRSEQGFDYWVKVVVDFNNKYKLSLDNIIVGGIDTTDYPDFCDAFIESADYYGVAITNKELDYINEDKEFVLEQVMNWLN